MAKEMQRWSASGGTAAPANRTAMYIGILLGGMGWCLLEAKAADQLDVVVPHLEHAPRRLAHHRERLPGARGPRGGS